MNKTTNTLATIVLGGMTLGGCIPITDEFAPDKIVGYHTGKVLRYVDYPELRNITCKTNSGIEIVYPLSFKKDNEEFNKYRILKSGDTLNIGDSIRYPIYKDQTNEGMWKNSYHGATTRFDSIKILK